MKKQANDKAGADLREVRSFPVAEFLLEQRAENGLPQIKGHAAVFNSLSGDLGGFRETIKPGAFAKSLKGGADVRALIDHDPSKIIARSKNGKGTLSVKEDKVGLSVDISPADTTAGRDIVESIQRGDVDSMSFGFRTIEDQWHVEDGEDIRTLIEVELFDVSPVSFPAYPQTDVAVRSRDAWTVAGRPGAAGQRFADDAGSVGREKIAADLGAGGNRRFSIKYLPIPSPRGILIPESE